MIFRQIFFINFNVFFFIFGFERTISGALLKNLFESSPKIRVAEFNDRMKEIRMWVRNGCIVKYDFSIMWNIYVLYDMSKNISLLVHRRSFNAPFRAREELWNLRWHHANELFLLGMLLSSRFTFGFLFILKSEKSRFKN